MFVLSEYIYIYYFIKYYIRRAISVCQQHKTNAKKTLKKTCHIKMKKVRKLRNCFLVESNFLIMQGRKFLPCILPR